VAHSPALLAGAKIDTVDVNGCTPLHLAAQLGTPAHQRMVSLLVDAGATINATNSVRKTPLHLAATGGPRWSPGVAKGAAGASASATLPPSSASVASAPVGEDDILPEGNHDANSDGGSAMVVLLVRLGANLEALDNHDNTPLISAAKHGNYLTVDTLLHLGAHVYAANVRGQTALHIAAFSHQLPVVVGRQRFSRPSVRMLPRLTTKFRIVSFKLCAPHVCLSHSCSYSGSLCAGTLRSGF
jgi:ankyrin repeat protein